MRIRLIALSFLISTPVALHSMGVGETEVVGLDDLTETSPGGVSEQLRQYAAAERGTLIALYGQEKYEKMRKMIGSQLFGEQVGPKRNFGNADFSPIIEQLAISNRLAQETIKQGNENRVEDLARLKKLDCRGLVFGAISATIAGVSALVSILVATKVIP